MAREVARRERARVEAEVRIHAPEPAGIGVLM
jgi:hypothetical protein